MLQRLNCPRLSHCRRWTGNVFQDLRPKTKTKAKSQRFQDQDRDLQKWVSRFLKIKTQVLRTPSLPRTTIYGRVVMARQNANNAKSCHRNCLCVAVEHRIPAHHWCTPCPEKKVPLCQILTNLQNSFTITLSSKFAIKKSLNISPSFTHVATLPCQTVVLKNRKLHCRPILKTFNDNKQLHNKIICTNYSINSHILVSN